MYVRREKERESNHDIFLSPNLTCFFLLTVA